MEKHFVTAGGRMIAQNIRNAYSFMTDVEVAMKGRVSPTLDKILRDPKGREQLKERLLTGTNGRIDGTDKSYIVTVDVTSASIPPRKNG